MGRTSRTAWLVLAGLGMVLALYFWRGKAELADFEVFYRAGERFLVGQPLCQTADGHYQFKYLPASALFFLPLALVPLEVAKLLWMIVVVTSLSGLVYGSWRLIGRAEDRWQVLLIPTLLVMAKYYVRELELGQANAVFGLIALAALSAWLSGRDILGGILIGIAVIIKPYALIFIPYLLVTRHFRALIWSTLTVVVGCLIPVLRYGLEGALQLHGDWLHLVRGSTPGLLTNPDNVSLFGAVAKWIGPGTTATLLALASAGAVVLTLAHAVTRPTPARGFPVTKSRIMITDFASLLLVIPLLSPQGWDHVFLLATPGIMLLISVRRVMKKIWWWILIGIFAVVGLSLYDLMGRELYRAFMDSSILTICFAVIFVYLFWLRIRLSNQITEIDGIIAQ